MRSILSATALSAALALAVPALAQPASPGAGAPGSMGTGSMGTGSTGSPSTRGAQVPGGVAGSTPGSPLPMTQPSPGTMSDSQRPSTAAGAMGATSGQSGSGQAGTQSLAMDESQVRDLLRSQGYSEVESVMRDGNHFRARVTRNGRPADITVDAYTGTIRNQAARR